MKRLWLSVGVLVCVFVFNGISEEERGNHDDDYREEIEVFDRNIRITFESLPLDAGDKGFFVVTATPEFEARIRMEGEGRELEFEVEGEVQLLDSGNFFIELESHMRVSSKNGEAEFGLETGVILVPGTPLAVTRMGEKTLMVTASYEEKDE